YDVEQHGGVPGDRGPVAFDGLADRHPPVQCHHQQADGEVERVEAEQPADPEGPHVAVPLQRCRDDVAADQEEHEDPVHPEMEPLRADRGEEPRGHVLGDDGHRAEATQGVEPGEAWLGGSGHPPKPTPGDRRNTTRSPTTRLFLRKPRGQTRAARTDTTSTIRTARSSSARWNPGPSTRATSRCSLWAVIGRSMSRTFSLSSVAARGGGSGRSTSGGAAMELCRTAPSA